MIESFAEGGSLITARFALEQNREVFALPGRITKETSRGTNRLIQRGHAKLVMDVDDLLQELPEWTVADPGAVDAETVAANSPPAAEALSGDAETLYEALTDTPVHVDQLCEKTGLEPSSALPTLLELEFEGLVRQLAGKQFRRS